MSKFSRIQFVLFGIFLLLALPARAQNYSDGGWTGWQQPESAPAGDYITNVPSARYLNNEFGMRYWFTTGSLSYNVSKPKISSLDYKEDNSQSEEVYFRMASRNERYLIKGYLGIGNTANGNLDDSDYENGRKISDTNSDLGDGRLQHVYLDLGYKLNSLSTSESTTSAIVGAGYFQDVMNARGLTCKQASSGSLAGICNSAGENLLSDNIKVIQNDARFTALRVGLENNWSPSQRVTWRNEIALVPFAQFRDNDNHYLRSDLGTNGPNFRDNGMAVGTQLETVFEYRFAPAWSLDFGGRYWIFWAPQTSTKVGNTPFVLGKENSYDWLYQRLGGYVGLAYHF